MSRRPRLVEEGSPICYNGNDNNNVNNHDDNRYNDNDTKKNSNNHHGIGHRLNNNTATTTTTTSFAPSATLATPTRKKRENSSLAAATSSSGGRPYAKRGGAGYKRPYIGGGAGGVRTRLVIGGGDDDDDDNDDNYNENSDAPSNNVVGGNTNGGNDSFYNKGNVNRTSNYNHQHQHYNQHNHRHEQQDKPMSSHLPQSSPFHQTSATATVSTAPSSLRHDNGNTPATTTANPFLPSSNTSKTLFPPSSNLSYERNGMELDENEHHYQQQQSQFPFQQKQQQQHYGNNIFQQQYNQQQEQYEQPRNQYLNQQQFPQHHYQHQHDFHDHNSFSQQQAQQQKYFHPNHHQQQQQHDQQHQNHYHHEQQPQQQPSNSIFSPPLSSSVPQKPSSKDPLVVIDGANIAYNYADAASSITTASTINKTRNKESSMEPNVLGIEIVVNYFAETCRVSVVLPATWMRSKPRDDDVNRENAMMVTPQLETLQFLKSRGYLCIAPPKDDDDAYVLAIARKADEKGMEERRLRRKNDGNKGRIDSFDNMEEEGENEASGITKDDEEDEKMWGRGYVLSADFFRDAIQRDEQRRRKSNGDFSGVSLKQWLERGSYDYSDNRLMKSGSGGPGRISYSFCHVGSTDDFGNAILDFVPNPRHPLVEWIERKKQRMKNKGV